VANDFMTDTTVADNPHRDRLMLDHGLMAAFDDSLDERPRAVKGNPGLAFVAGTASAFDPLEH
jgi:hypothetical protein